MLPRALRIGGFFVGSFVATALAGVWARRGSADPARCAALVAAGTRCCAPGQRVEGDRCVGTPSSCPPPLRIDAAGCVGRAARVRAEGGTLHAGAGDWEAEGRVRAHEAKMASFAMASLEITEEAYEACQRAGRCPAVPLSGEPGR